MGKRLLDIENLTSKRKDSLGFAVAALLGRTACGISLDKEELAFLRIPLGTIRKFARHSGA